MNPHEPVTGKRSQRLRAWRCGPLGVFLCLLVSVWPAVAAVMPEPLRLGVLATRPQAQANARWQPLADYLAATLGVPVTVETLRLAELDRAVRRNAYDVIITNPGHFVRLQQEIGLEGPLLTMMVREAGMELPAFGGVIVVRSEQQKINTLQDLAGQHIAAIEGEGAFGSYLMQAFEMYQAGVEPPRGRWLVSIAGAQDAVIEAVLAGQADAGFVRSGVIEAMAREGRLDPARIRIVNRQNLPAWPYVSSTRLYPEWPVVALPHVDERLVRRLTIALLALSTADTPTRPDLPGFTNPANYETVADMMRTLRYPPFDAVPPIRLADLWARHAAWLVTLLTLGLLLFGAGAGLAWQNRRIRTAHARIAHIAHHDTLTGLPNRLLLIDRLQQVMAQMQRRDRLAAVAFIDLDGFKEVNDRHGHDAGDELLVAIARRLAGVLREGDTLARLGGDEFIAVLVDLEQMADCKPVLDRLLQAASDPVAASGGLQLQVSASIGVSLYPADGATTDLLLRHADLAMYAAKQAGKNCCRFHAEATPPSG